MPLDVVFVRSQFPAFDEPGNTGQSFSFNEHVTDKRLNPTGPNHAQVGCAGAVLDGALV